MSSADCYYFKSNIIYEKSLLAKKKVPGSAVRDFQELIIHPRVIIQSVFFFFFF